MKQIDISEAFAHINKGNVIAYPTEAVYGLGCDPFNRDAVFKLLALKKRKASQGLILIISEWAQLQPLVKPLTSEQQNQLSASWPGHTTWIFPKSTHVPDWISGEHPSVAIRMTNHPIANALCQHGPIVSTSANISGQPPAINTQDLEKQFPEGLSAVVKGDLGGAKKPSRIIDIETGNELR